MKVISLKKEFCRGAMDDCYDCALFETCGESGKHYLPIPLKEIPESPAVDKWNLAIQNEKKRKCTNYES